MRPQPKSLVAQNAGDLEVISSLMQDAAIVTAEMAYDRSARRFALLASRYMGEAGTTLLHPKGWRIRAALHFDHVTAVQARGFMPGSDDTVLSLLAIGAADDSDDLTITLTCAGGAGIKLSADSINAVMTDQGPPRDALRRPLHNTSDAVS